MPIISHQALQLKWIQPTDIPNPKTLVLGSFNPFNPDGDTVDYYYGRSSNFFWKRIAVILGHEETFFLHREQGFTRKLDAMSNRFCCLDIVNHIKVDGQNDEVVNKYIKNRIFSNFADSELFKSKFNGGNVNLRRVYNETVLETLKNTKSINKVIHTMGPRRITDRIRGNPKELNRGTDGLFGFMSQVFDTCDKRDIALVFDSFSPSAYAVKNKSTQIPDLDNWLIEHLHLDGNNAME